MENKTCTKCGQEFPYTNEHFHKRGSGLRSDCKKCNNAKNKNWRELNPEKVKIKSTRYYANNREKIKTRKKIWLANNPEKAKAYRETADLWRRNNTERVKKVATKYRESNLEKIKTRQKLWRISNPEKAKECNVKWRKNNPEKAKESSAKWKKKNYKKVKEWDDRWRKNNPEKAKRSIVNLSDSYVAARMNKKISEIPVEMIEMKRMTLLLKRELGIGAGRKMKTLS